MIKIKEFTELTEKVKASIRELIDDCIRYEQLELAVPDLNEEDGTAYLYYQSSKNPKLISVLFCYDLEDYLEVSSLHKSCSSLPGCFHKSVPEAYGRIRGNSSMLLSRWKQL